MDKIKWARKDSATGKGMNKGFCCFDGEYYFENQSDLIKWLRSRNVDEYNELSDEFLLDEAYAEEEYYFTEWDIEDSDYYYEEQEDGTLVEVVDNKYMCNSCHNLFSASKMDFDSDNESDLCENCN